MPAANYTITTNGDICCHDLAYVNQDGGDPAYYSLYASMKAKADIEHTHSRFDNLGIGDDALVAYSLITAGKVRIGTTVATDKICSLCMVSYAPQ